jgi:hypothetical protein
VDMAKRDIRAKVGRLVVVKALAANADSMVISTSRDL